MTDHLSKAIEESEEKSAFVCSSCGHKNIPKATDKSKVQSKETHDQFSEASNESAEKSAFVCVSCGQKQ